VTVRTGIQQHASPHSRFRPLQYAFAIYGLAIYESAIVPVLRVLSGHASLQPGESDVFGTLSQMVVLCGCLLFLIAKFRENIRYARFAAPYLCIVLLCFGSTVWSAYPYETFRRCITLSTCLVFGLYCYWAFGLNRLLKLIAHVTIVLLLLSIFAYFALPGVGHEDALGYGNAMRGIFSHKNTLASNTLLALAAFLYLLLTRQGSAAYNLFGVMLTSLGIYMAHSSTSILLAGVLFVIGTMTASWKSWRLGVVVSYLGVCVLLVLTGLLVLAPDAIFSALDRSSDLTGRLPLWRETIAAASLKPLLGYGYAGFWNEDSTLVKYIWDVVQWQAPSAHCGYIDVVLQTGLIGLALYLWIWAVIISGSFAARGDDSFRERIWIYMFMVVNVLINTDEGPLPYPDIYTVVTVTAFFEVLAWRYRTQGSPREAGPAAAMQPHASAGS
jgi:exopolysaccharide production protein ExoQ